MKNYLKSKSKHLIKKISHEKLKESSRKIMHHTRRIIKLPREKIKQSSRHLIRHSRNLIILLIILTILGAGLFYIQTYFETPQQAAEKIRSLGLIGPLVIIALLVLEVIVAPIPGFIVAIASGYAFGPIYGTIYTYIGNVLGTFIAFYISRRFGRPLVERLVKKEKLERYDKFFQDEGIAVFWAGYLFPIFPSDIISFLAGLTSIKWRKFIPIVVIAYIPYVLLFSLFGASLYESGIGKSTLIFGSILFFILVVALFVYLKWRKDARNS
ncbi:TVP38/TMEM64 family protein [Candidatus Woesearchaeota archaeon]|nr:TVP38/TMEM64 family protein [Candidatus Woesearchaeota archaeon]